MPVITREPPEQLLERMREYLALSGYSLRDIAAIWDIDTGYLSMLFNGKRRFSRDLVLGLAYVFSLQPFEVDELLLMGGFPPIGREALRQFKKEIREQRK